MDETFARGLVLPPGRLHALSTRRDGPGLVRAAVHTGGLVVCLTLAGSAHPAARGVGLAGAGLLWGLLFGLLHETSHRTAFRTRALNDALYGLSCLAHLFTPTGYRAFHGEHHRHTHDPTRDPEIAPAPAVLGAWPRSGVVHLLLATGVHLVVLKLALLLGMATGWARLYAAFLPWVPTDQRRRVAWEARGVLLVWAIVVALAAGSGLAQDLLLTQLLGHLVLAPLLMAEHHGLPGGGDVLGRTRSIDTLPPLRWLFWNMPWHAEHHGWPSVPFHALPALHDEVADRLPERARGYLAVHVAARR